MEKCPIYIVKVYVKDKNYSNIDNVLHLKKRDENLPYSEYIGTIYYQLNDVKTGRVVAEKFEETMINNEQFYTISFDDISQGDYNLTVWGNISSETATGTLHNGGNELTDLYVVSKNLSFTSEYSSDQLMLERTKGDLLLVCSNFPPGITRVEEKISSLYDLVDPYLKYAGNTTVIKTGPVKSLIEASLAPSVTNGNSKLNLRFSSDTVSKSSDDLIIPEIPLIMNRNQVTVVEVNYNKITGGLEIWTYVNDEWTMIHHLDILNAK
ncbi:hypothetical protein [Parabacteroides faecis]|uniref:hypothetical protein n=1 Tax=Parabacteroides faecis TaxID=1217282 RepID=UPI003522D19E